MAITVNFTGKAGIAGTESDPTGVVTDVGNSVAYGMQERIGVWKSRVDVGAIPASLTKTNSDVYQALHIPAHYKVLSAWFEVVEAEATNTTAQVALGITGGTTNGFVTAATVAAIATHSESNGGTYSAAGGWSSNGTADTLDLLVSVAALTNAVFDVYAVVIDQRAAGDRD
jgi:hypothetical protein